MTRKPSKNWNRSATSPPAGSQKKYFSFSGRCLGLAAGWMMLALLTPFAGCNSRPGYRVLDSPFPVIDSRGRERPYRVFLPSPEQGMPMLVYFHGVMSSGFRTIPSLKDYTGSPVEETGLIEFCRENRIILLVPEAVYSYQFLGQTASGWLPFDRECPGIEKIIDLMADRYPVSKNHIYLAGISAGAGMCHHLANRRPEFYSAILSHSQGYVDRDSHLLEPAVPGPQFGVVFAYTRGDYDNLVDICIKSEQIYRQSGYRTVLLKDLPPTNHSWSGESNRRFWRILQAVKRPDSHSTQRSGSQP